MSLPRTGSLTLWTPANPSSGPAFPARLNGRSQIRKVQLVPTRPEPATVPVSDSTLGRFREAAASAQPTPAGVAVAAVSASFAFGLLAKALAVSGRKAARSGDPGRLEPLTAAARAESSRMLQLAGDDSAAFEAYLEAARLPRSTERERLERQQALDSAILRVIDLPLAAAYSAAAGLRLCADGLAATHRVVLADLATAVSLLGGALRAFLLCAESNVNQLPPQASVHRERLAQEAERHREGLRQAEELLDRIAVTLQTARAEP
jgi:methenyltetrahydrofolate cyclohydrolase